MKTIHLTAGLGACMILLASVMAGTWYAQVMEDRYVRALAPLQAAQVQKNQGVALAAAAFRQPDLLPIYGSSELDMSNPYRASTLFANYPAGFTVFPVGKAGTADLIILQDLAAVGPGLRGRKVVISVSAPWFFVNTQSPDSYAGNFSRLHACALVFGSSLSFRVKHDAARRMLQYPDTIKNDYILAFALRALASDSSLEHAAYYLIWPLGQIETWILRLQDHWETVELIDQQLHDKKLLAAAVPQARACLDWTSLIAKATREQTVDSSSNPFGFENKFWVDTLHADVSNLHNTLGDFGFTERVRQATEWTDFDLLLRGLRDMGARPIILSMPLKGVFYDYEGITRTARQAWYDRIGQVTAQYGVTARNFADHDADRYFLIDTGAHISKEGWIYYDLAIDAFYHGTLNGDQGVDHHSQARPNSASALLSGDYSRLDRSLR